MSIHDWTRVSVGTFHDFHQGWTIEIRNTLNSEVLPDDPQGIVQAIWDELGGESLGTRPADKLLTVAAYDAGNELTAYVDALAVGDLLPDAPLFLAPGWYVNVPLEQTYTASWDVTPKPIRDLVAAPRTAVQKP